MTTAHEAKDTPLNRCAQCATLDATIARCDEARVELAQAKQDLDTLVVLLRLLKTEDPVAHAAPDSLRWLFDTRRLAREKVDDIVRIVANSTQSDCVDKYNVQTYIATLYFDLSKAKEAAGAGESKLSELNETVRYLETMNAELKRQLDNTVKPCSDVAKGFAQATRMTIVACSRDDDECTSLALDMFDKLVDDLA